jgi:tripartite ATP-independent transporter DctP family solute receptor
MNVRMSRFVRKMINLKIKFWIIIILIFNFVAVFFFWKTNRPAILAQSTQCSLINAPLPRPAKGHYLFRLAEALTKEYPSTIGDLEFARLVKERSHGRIQIIVCYDAKLGDEKSVIEQVRFGGIDFARVNAAPIAEIYRPMTVLSLPYLFRDSEHLWEVLYGPIGDELLRGLSSRNLIGLTYYTSAARSFYFTRPVHDLAAIKGLRIRVLQSKYYMDFIRALGAAPIVIPFSDVADAFTSGAIDGAENNWASYYEIKHYQLAKYYLVDTHTRSPEVLLVNSQIFAQMSPADQALIRQAARDSVRKEWDASFAKEASSEVNVRKAGVQVINLSQAEIERFRQAASILYTTYGKDYHGLIQKIRDTE